MLWCELSDAEALPLARRVGWQVFCLLTGFWQELADICLGQAVRQHNGLFKSAFLHWNVSIYPSSTWLDKCPAHPTVIGLACFRMLDSNSSYQHASFFLTSVSELASCVKKKSCSYTILLFYKSPLFLRYFSESWFYFSGKSSSKHVSKFEDWYCFGLAQIKSLFSYRTHSKNLACKIFKLAFLTLGLDPPLGSEDF